MKKVLALILSLILALSLAGVAAAEANEDFTLGYNGVVTLNPLMTQASNDHNVFYLTQLQLVRYYNSELFFDGAEKCDMNEDATVFTFTLRDGLKWSDGTDLTANDYAYYLSMLLDPDSFPKHGVHRRQRYRYPLYEACQFERRAFHRGV